MQNGFFQKLVLSALAGLLLAGFVEFYKNFVQGADDALNGKHRHVKPAMAATPTPPH